MESIKKLLFFAFSIIVLGVALIPIVLAVLLSPYWLFLYLVYLIVIVAFLLILAVKFEYVKKKDATPKKC